MDVWLRKMREGGMMTITDRGERIAAPVAGCAQLRAREYQLACFAKAKVMAEAELAKWTNSRPSI